MKAQVCTVFVLSLLVTSPVASQAKGCIKGAVVGGVAGHYAGRHPIIGAIGGCVVGRHLAKAKAAKVRNDAIARQSGEQAAGAQGYGRSSGGSGVQGDQVQQSTSAPSYGSSGTSHGYTGGAYSSTGQTPAHGAPISLTPSFDGQSPPAQATYTRTPYLQ